MHVCVFRVHVCVCMCVCSMLYDACCDQSEFVCARACVCVCVPCCMMVAGMLAVPIRYYPGLWRVIHEGCGSFSQAETLDNSFSRCHLHTM